MTALIIIGTVLFALLAVLFVPVRADAEYFESFRLKISFLGIPLYKNKPQKTKVKSKKAAEKGSKEAKVSLTEGLKAHFSSVKEKQGFSAAVKEGAKLAGLILKDIKKLLAHINICNLRLSLTVATCDAAKTAIEYGIVCQAVYPVLSALESNANVGLKEINISADFNSDKATVGFGTTVKLQIFYLLAAAFKIFKTLKKFSSGEIENERK